MRQCRYCLKEFEPKPDEMKKQRYCSTTCVRRAHYWRNHAESIQRMKQWRAQNPEAYKASKRKHYQANKGKVNLAHKDWQLRHDHNMTLAEYDFECAKRGNKCDICGVVCLNRTLRIDHDHSTQARRGMLCDSCNLGLGKLRDSSKVLQAAADYLRRFGC